MIKKAKEKGKKADDGKSTTKNATAILVDTTDGDDTAATPAAGAGDGEPAVVDSDRCLVFAFDPAFIAKHAAIKEPGITAYSFKESELNLLKQNSMISIYSDVFDCLLSTLVKHHKGRLQLVKYRQCVLSRQRERVEVSDRALGESQDNSKTASVWILQTGDAFIIVLLSNKHYRVCQAVPDHDLLRLTTFDSNSNKEDATIQETWEAIASDVPQLKHSRIMHVWTNLKRQQQGLTCGDHALLFVHMITQGDHPNKTDHASGCGLRHWSIRAC